MPKANVRRATAKHIDSSIARLLNDTLRRGTLPIPAHQSAYYRKFYVSNREKVQALNKAWLKANPDWVKAAKHNRRYSQRRVVDGG
jgi:hypothetical protein